MNLRLSILLVTVLLIFGGTFLVVRFTGGEDAPEQRPWLYRMNDDSIVHIAVSRGGQTVDYERKPGGGDWYILGDPEIPVFDQKWGGTPLLFSGPRVSRVLSSEIKNPPSFGLEPPSTRVIVTDRNSNSVEFHLGNQTPDARHHYARLVGDPALFTVPEIWARVVNELATEPPYLRLFQIDGETLVLIEVSNNGGSATYQKNLDSGQWIIQGATEVPVFQEKWGETPQILSGPRAEQLVARSFDNPEDYGLDPPQVTVRLGHGTNEIVEFHLGDATADGEYLYATVVGRPELYAIPKLRAQGIIDLAVEPPYPPEIAEETAESG